MQELWDLYNSKRERTGLSHVRGQAIPSGYYHLVVHVWIRNSRGEYLISQRSASREAHPLKWECVGGSVLMGEDSLSGALRETEEEVGVKLKPEDGRLVCSVVGRVIDGMVFSDILDVWLFRYDGEVDLGRASTDEVAQTVWLDISRIRELYDRGELVHTLGYFFEEKEFIFQPVPTRPA